jgi:hypothetical protein
MALQLQPGDIFLTRGKGFLSKAIRVFTRVAGESRTVYNHTGLVVSRGGLQEVEIVEALISVQQHTLWSQYGPPSKDEVAVYRPIRLSLDELQKVVDEGKSYVGRDYGALKLLAHFFDWCLQGAYVFRRLASMDKYPICSWVVAYAYDEIDIGFDVPPNAASPDDIADFIENHPEMFTLIYPLNLLSE